MYIDDQYNISIDIGLSLFGLVIFFCNMVVLVAIIPSPNFHSPTNIFLAGMAFADAAAGLIVISVFPVVLNCSLSFTTCHLLVCIYYFISNTSNFMVAGFTLHRLYTILSPPKYDNIANCKCAILLISFLGALGLISGLVPFYLIEDSYRQYYNGSEKWACKITSTINPIYMDYVQCCAIYGSNLLVVVVANIYTICVIRRNARKIAALGIIDGEPASSKRTSKAQKFLVKITSIFIVCTSPLHLQYFLFRYDIKLPVASMVWPTIILNATNSLINPFIYAYSNKKLKTAIENIIACRRVSTRKSQPAPILRLMIPMPSPIHASRSVSPVAILDIQEADSDPKSGKRASDDQIKESASSMCLNVKYQ